MRQVWAIARLTFAEGIRMRIVLIFLLVLGFLVLRLPFALRGDETLAGRLQTFLDYSLGATGILLSLATVMLSASTLATEFRDKTLHLVTSKPVARFRILLGKWLGVVLLNGLLLGLCAATIYAFALFIATRPETSNVADRLKVDDVVWTARQSATPTKPDFEALAARQIESEVASGDMPPTAERAAIRERVEALKREWRVIPAGTQRLFRFEGLPPPRPGEEVVQIRFKVRATPLPINENARVGWLFVDPDSGAWLHERPLVSIEMTGHTHQLLVPAQAIRDGRAALVMINLHDPDREGTRLNLDGDGALRLYYKVASFEDTYLKAMGLIMLRLCFLAAVGLFFGTFVSFPVAVFCGMTWFVVCMGRPFWVMAVGMNQMMLDPSQDPYWIFGPPIRAVLRVLLYGFFPDFTAFSGARSLVEGVYIPATTMFWATGQLLGLSVALLFVVGWLIFKEREVAETTV